MQDYIANNLISSLFGSKFAEKHWVEIDLNACAATYHQSSFFMGENRLLHSDDQGNLIKEIYRNIKADHTWGGYLEDRRTLWRDSYLPQNSMIHLGIDFTVPEGTVVHMPVSAKVVRGFNNGDQNHGWGGRVDFWVEEFGLYMILGHLGEGAELSTPDLYIGKGHRLGIIGSSAVNGGWFPHLHLQLVSKTEYERYQDPMEIDGYGKLTLDIRARYPNPKILAL